MYKSNATIPLLFGLSQPDLALKRQIKTVLLAMSILCLIVCVAAIFFADAKAMLAALAGGLSQIAAVWVYGRIARSDRIFAPKAILARHLIAQIVKVTVALVLLLIGALIFGPEVVWFIAAFSITLTAYWLALILT